MPHHFHRFAPFGVAHDPAAGPQWCAWKLGVSPAAEANDSGSRRRSRRCEASRAWQSCRGTCRVIAHKNPTPCLPRRPSNAVFHDGTFVEFDLGAVPTSISCDRDAQSTRNVRSEDKVGQSTPSRAGEVSTPSKHLDADMIGAGIVMFLDSCGDGWLFTPGHDRVDEPIGCLFRIGPILIAEPETPKIGEITRSPEVKAQIRPPNLPRCPRVGLEHDHLLGRHKRLRSDNLPGKRGVVWSREVWMHSIGSRGCQPKHPGTQSCQHPVNGLRWRHRTVRGCVHLVEI